MVIIESKLALGSGSLTRYFWILGRLIYNNLDGKYSLNISFHLMRNSEKECLNSQMILPCGQFLKEGGWKVLNYPT